MITRDNITSKQRSKMKSLAATATPIAQIGKGGVTDNLLKTLSDALEARELIKVNILATADDDAVNLAENVADLLDAIPVAVIGRKAIFYRPFFPRRIRASRILRQKYHFVVFTAAL